MQDETLNLNDYLAVIRRRRWIIAFIFAFCMALVLLYVVYGTPIYKAESLIRYEPPMAANSGSQSSGTPTYMLDTVLDSEVAMLTSLDMALRTSKKLGIDPKDLAGHKIPLLWLYNAQKDPQSSLILVDAKGPSAAAAAGLANTISDLFVEWDRELRSQDARRILQDRLSQRKELEATLAVLEEKKRGFLEAHPDTGLTAALANTLLNLQEKRNELLRQFTPNHPDVIKMEARIAQVQKQLSLLPLFQEELDHIDREIKTRRDAFFELSRQIEESKIAIDSVLSYVKIVSRARPPLKPWTPLAVIDLPIGMVLGLFMGVFIAFVLESMDISISSIEEIEKVLEAPVLGIIPHFGAPSAWRDFFSRVLRSDSHNEESIRASLVFRHPPKSPQVEAYQNMRVNIQSQLSKSDNIILTFTSTGVSEGKTLTSINFSLAAAHAGLKTLIIGADTRRPNFHRIFGLPKDAGLIEVLKGQIPWQSTLRSMVDLMMGESDLAKMASFPGIDNLKVMTGWCEDTASVPGLFSSPALPALIAEMRPYFNVIVFDCPPLLLFADALLIAPHTDGTVMIYRSGKMARNALKRARDQLVASKGKLVGLVFNDAKAVDMPSGYGDYGDYGHYAQLQKPNPG